MTDKLCMRCYISGKVQGVWFRNSAKEEAERLGVSGWARNLEDGRVEIFACGFADKLDQFHDWLKQGPRLAEVEECQRENVPWQAQNGFAKF